MSVARFLLANGADRNIKTTAGQDVETVRTGGGAEGAMFNTHMHACEWERELIYHNIGI